METEEVLDTGWITLYQTPLANPMVLELFVLKVKGKHLCKDPTWHTSRKVTLMHKIKKGKGVLEASTSKQSTILGKWKATFNQKGRKKVNPKGITSHTSIPKVPEYICHYCGLMGHMKVECRKRLNDWGYILV